MRYTKEQRKSQILQESTKLFVERGYRGTTTKDIAEACGVSEPVIYKHYRSKDVLFWTVINSLTGEVVNDITFNKVQDTEHMIFSFIENRVAAISRNFPIFKRLLTEILENEEIRAYYYHHFVPQMAGPLLVYIEQLQEQGLVKKDFSAKVVALTVAGILVMAVLAKNLEEDSAFSALESEQLVKTMTNMLLHGVIDKVPVKYTV